MNVSAIGKPRVLVLAYPELAVAIRNALIDVAHVDVGGRITDLPSLCSAVFPSDHHIPSSMFRWGAYHFVMIQDLWLDRDKASLELAGYELAHLDFYERGNFGTKKVLLVQDPTLALVREKLPQTTTTTGRLTVLNQSLDIGRAFEFVPLVKGDTSPIGQLRNLVCGRRDNAKSAPMTHDAQIQRQRPLSMIEEVRANLRRYVAEQATVIGIDDEPETLQTLFQALTGNTLTDPRVKEHQVNIMSVCVHPRDSQVAAEFSTLVSKCEEEFDAVVKEKNQVIFVTDILFNLPNWEKTGIDLIQRLRFDLGDRAKGRIGIVAFTNFWTPSINMSAYLRGADFVVHKGASVSEHHGSTMSGPDRLLIVLALLCFQRQFLSEQRGCCTPIDKKDKSARSDKLDIKATEDFKRILPEHAASLHVKEEWQDTLYLLKAAQIYGRADDQFARTWNDIDAKYASK